MSLNYDYTKKVEKYIDSAINNGLLDIARTMESYAKKKCPVDTGRLRNSITHKLDEQEHTLEVGSAVEYAEYVENGTYKMAAQPFLYPAATRHTTEYEELFTSRFK